MLAAFAQGICCRNRFERLADKDGYIKIGPIPKGAPVNLIGNLDPDFGQLVVLQAKIVKALVKIHAMNLSPDEATAELNKSGSGIAGGK